MRHSLVQKATREDGAIALLVAVLLSFALLGLAALGTDVGMVAQERRQLQSAADAGALAGVQMLPASLGDENDVKSEAEDFVGRNIASDRLELVRTALGYTQLPNGSSLSTSITVEVEGQTPLAFARIWGKTSARARASATAALSSPQSYGAYVVPVGVLPEAIVTMTPGDAPIVLKFDPGPGLGPGKFGWTAVSPDGLNPNDINDIFEQGGVEAEMGPVSSRPGVNNADRLQALLDTVAADECVGARYTEDYFVQKNKGGLYSHVEGMNRDEYYQAVQSHFDEVVSWEQGDAGLVTIKDYDCQRLVICPVVENLDVNKDLSIVGFAWFFVWDIQGLDKWDPSQQPALVGKFIRPVNPDDPRVWGAYDPYGAVGKSMLVE